MKYMFLLLVLLSSCSNDTLIKYSVYSDQGEFDILYSYNIKDTGDIQWSDEIASKGEVFIYVQPKEQNQTLDVRVMYIANNGIELYKRVVSDKPILIKGKIRALP